MLYKPFDIWHYQDQRTMVRYRCFEVIPLGKFCIQSKDFYRRPLDELLVKQLDAQFLELLFDDAPDKRSELFDSVEEAIAAHEVTFSG